MKRHIAASLKKSVVWPYLCTQLLFAQTPLQRTITTIAGRDNVFSTTGTNPATTPLLLVTSVAVDSTGNVFLAAPQDKVVLEITADGRLILVAGNGLSGCPSDGAPASASSLSEPQGVAVDSRDDLYIADRNCNRIYKVRSTHLRTPRRSAAAILTSPPLRESNSSSTITTIAGSENSGYGGDGRPAIQAQLSDPTGVAVGADNSVYIADSANNVIRKVDPNGIITTIAGNGTRGFSDGGGQATQASLAIPMGLTVDNNGNVYIADSGNSLVRKVTPAGRIAVFAGSSRSAYCGDGGLATSACLIFPTGVFMGSDGLYIADAENNCVRRVGADNVISTFAGVCGAEGFSGDGGRGVTALFNLPWSVAMHNGTLFVADSNNGRVRAVNSGTINTIAGTGDRGDGGPAIEALLSGPRGVATDSIGNVYIADTFNNRVRKVTASGLITTVAGDGNARFAGDGGQATAASLSGPTRVIVDPKSNNLYIADSSNGRIRKIDPSSGNISTFPQGGLMLSDPRGMCFDSHGNLYVTENAAHRVRKIAPDGTASIVAGTGKAGFSGDGSLAIQAQLNEPTGVAVDSADNLYIADSQNTRIRRVGLDGIITTVAGTNPGQCVDPTTDALKACFGYPTGIRIDNSNDLYIADYVVWRVNHDGTLETIAGNEQTGFYGDGGPAINAALASPSDVALDPSGNLYIADTRNNRIRAVVAITPSISVSTSALTFSVNSGGPVQVQDVRLTTSLNSVPFTANVSPQNGPNWLSVEPTSGTAPATLHIAVDPAAVSNSQYQGTVTISSPVANVPSPVTVTVINSGPPATRIAFQSGPVSIQVASGSSQSQTINIVNLSNGDISLALTANTTTGVNWLSISPTLTLPAGNTRAVMITAKSLSLPPGIYAGQVVATVSPTEQYVLSVTMLIGSAKARMLLSSSALWFDATVSGGPPPSVNVYVINSGDADLNWSATVKSQGSCNTLSPWLSVENAQNAVVKAGDSGMFSVRVDNAGLSQGTCSGLISVSALASDNSPQTLSVTLSLANSISDLEPRIVLSDSMGLFYTGIAGVVVPTRSILIQSRNLLNPTFTVSVSVDQPWLDVNPVGEYTVGSADPFEIRVRPKFDSLTPGPYEGTLTIRFGSDARTYKVVAIASTPAGTSTPADTYNQTILADHPVAFWDINPRSGSEPDLSGNGNSGTYQGGTPGVSTMPNGDQAALFNGSNQYLTVASAPSLSIPATRSLTWEMWIQPTALQFPHSSSDGYVDLMGKCAGYSPTCEWEARMYNATNPEGRCSRLAAYAFNPTAGAGSGAYWQPICGLLQAASWIHVVAEYTTLSQPSDCPDDPTHPGSIDIWINGVKWSQSDHNPTGCMSQFSVIPQASSSPLNIGTMAGDVWFSGAIGKVAIYNYGLSQTQIANHYQVMTGRNPSGSCADTCTF